MSRAPDGSVLVLDDTRGEVDRFAPNGKFLGAFSSHPDGKGGLNSANDLTTDAQGNVYISALDPAFTDFRIDKLDAAGKLLVTMGTADLPDQANALDVDAAGRIFVTSASEVLVFGPDGKLITRWGSFGSGPGQIAGPGGIVLDGQGNVYVADFDGGRVEKFQLLPPLAPTAA
jgi:sugar lactone lactonase YvrE